MQSCLPNKKYVRFKSAPMFIFLLGIFLSGINYTASAQGQTNAELANQYFSTGDYDKAVVYYEKQYSFDPFGTYSVYLKCLLQLKDYDKAEKLIKKHFKKNTQNLEVLVDLGRLYETMGSQDKAKEQFEKAIKSLTPDLQQILNLANAFLAGAYNEYALQTYQAGRKVMQGTYPFNFEIAETYAQLGDQAKMIDEYLDLMEISEQYIPNLQTILQNKIYNDPSGKISEYLRVALLRRIQKNSDRVVYSEFLYWLFLQEKDFESALIQAKALDKRQGEEGSRLLTLGRLAASNGDYTTAEACFQYIMDKGKNGANYNSARMELISASSQRITGSNNYTAADLDKLEKDYTTALTDLGKTPATAVMMKNFAHLQAFYLNKTNDATTLLEECIGLPGVNAQFKADCKLELGDILILEGKVWDATLFYSQVDKDFKEDAIGREAKFRNARLSYYMGEFEWAAAQLNILKAATAQLISNDAMSLSLLISDNTGEDSDYTPLQIYSRADLLEFQHKHSLAIATFDSVISGFPAHSLTDEVWFRKAQIYEATGHADTAIFYFRKVLDEYPDDILADDALFNMADLEENTLKNKTKAQELYQELLTKYPGSLYVVEARKRFRELRGDKLN
jgi:tetratricopeptide (TPR) repeat protein